MTISQIDEFGHYDWDWAVVGAFIDESDGTFRVAFDCGCSCNSPWEDEDYGPRLNAKEAIYEVSQQETPYGMGSTEWISRREGMKQRIREADKAYKSGVRDFADWGYGN